MGKGDNRTRRGKISNSSYGNKRVHTLTGSEKLEKAKTKSARLKEIEKQFKASQPAAPKAVVKESDQSKEENVA